MNRFNKKLTISLPEQSLYSQENQSPSLQDTPHIEKDGIDSESAENRHETQCKLNFVEFEQFDYQKQVIKDEPHKHKQVSHLTPKSKTNFTISVPEHQQQSKFPTNDNKQHRMINENLSDHNKFREPPAPSKGSSRNKVFIFPTASKIPNNFVNQPQQQPSLAQIKRIFQRERQQFYKQKSRLQKQVLIKDGQIDMLQKIVKDKYSFNPLQHENMEPYHYNFSPRKQSTQLQIQQMSKILIQKDLQIAQLFDKIAVLNDCILKTNEQYNKKLLENSTLESMIETLKNQLYITQKKQANIKMTTNFYKHKKSCESRERSRQVSWDQDQINMGIGNYEFGRKGLIKLHKRIEDIQKNRMELDNRSLKIKSDIMPYSQSTRNRKKAAFDFNGRTFDNIRMNQTKHY